MLSVNLLREKIIHDRGSLYKTLHLDKAGNSSCYPQDISSGDFFKKFPWLEEFKVQLSAYNDSPILQFGFLEFHYFDIANMD